MSVKKGGDNYRVGIPGKQLQKAAEKLQNGECIAIEGHEPADPSFRLWAAVIRDHPKNMMLLGNCFTLAPSGPSFERVDFDTGQRIDFSMVRGEAFAMYFWGRNAYDINNQLRMGSRSIEDSVKTKLWFRRSFCMIMSTWVTNAYLAYRYFVLPHDTYFSFLQFKQALAAEILTEFASSTSPHVVGSLQESEWIRKLREEHAWLKYPPYMSFQGDRFDLKPGKHDQSNNLRMPREQTQELCTHHQYPCRHSAGDKPVLSGYYCSHDPSEGMCEACYRKHVGAPSNDELRRLAFSKFEALSLHHKS